jgi:c-di-GMP-binding flagellar brake protein YcgR
MSSSNIQQPPERKGSVDSGIFCPGTSVLFESPRLPDSRTQTFFRGCKQDEYLIIDHPQNDIGIPLMLKDGMPCIIRFLYEGKAFAFQSVIDKVLRYPYPFIFVTYPRELENLNLRNSERHNVRFPAVYNHKSGDKTSKTDLQGTILDLSAKGCLLETDHPQNPDSIVLVSFSLPNQKDIKNLAAKVRRVSKREETYRLGLMFMVSEDPDIVKINEYLSYLGTLQNNV